MESGGVPNGDAPPPPAPVVREQDRLMPIANVIRIMRRVLPPHAKVSDDAKEVIQECVSEFISFVTGEANERCHAERRKTVTAEDIVWALDRLGFDDYVFPLSVYLQRMRAGDSDGESRVAGHRAMPMPRAVPRAPPMSTLHGLQVQMPMPMPMQQPMYAAPPPPPLAHAVGMPMMQANGAPLVQVPGGERPFAPYEPYGAASGAGGYADEASSSNAAVNDAGSK